jgi:hypothetical protein
MKSIVSIFLFWGCLFCSLFLDFKNTFAQFDQMEHSSIDENTKNLPLFYFKLTKNRELTGYLHYENQDETKITTLDNREVIIPSSKELAEGLIENVEPIITKGEHAVFALLSASPFGAIIDIPRFLSESLGVAEKSVTLANNVLQIGNETIDKVTDQKSNFDKVVSDFGSIVDKANLKISSGLDNVRDSVNEYGENIMNETTSKEPPIEIQSLKTRKRGKSGGNLLKKLKRDAKMVGGRIIKSQTEFLRSNVKGSQYKTKRRKLNRKTKSRRR